MFDLETAIADWKQSLFARESLSTEDIAELESHLRDHVSSSDSMGLSGDEAFLIAQRRVGQPSDLDAEFAKETSINRWVHRSKWMCIGILALIFVRSAGSFLFQIVRLIQFPQQVDPMTLGIIYNMTAIACSWSIVLVGLFVVLRHDALVDRIVQRLARIPKPILIGVPIAVITALSVLILFNLYMTNGHGHTAFLLSSYAYSMSHPTLLLVAAYVLHRSEQRRALA
jgi:hypothetical protein